MFSLFSGNLSDCVHLSSGCGTRVEKQLMTIVQFLLVYCGTVGVGGKK